MRCIAHEWFVFERVHDATVAREATNEDDTVFAKPEVAPPRDARTLIRFASFVSAMGRYIVLHWHQG